MQFKLVCSATSRLLTALFILGAIAGCASNRYTNPAGQKVTWRNPMLTQFESKGGTYVLLEKSVADGKYKVINIGREKQVITNNRQERVVFTGDLQKYSVDFDEYRWQEYVDAGNYNQVTEIMLCNSALSRDKTASYNPCSSEFHYTFVPFGVTKAYVAGQISKAVKDSWEDPRQNNRVGADNPWGALMESGALEKLGIRRETK